MGREEFAGEIGDDHFVLSHWEAHIGDDCLPVSTAIHDLQRRGVLAVRVGLSHGHIDAGVGGEGPAAEEEV